MDVSYALYKDLNELLPICSIFFWPVWVKFGIKAVHVMLLGMVSFVKLSVVKSEDQISIFACVFCIVIWFWRVNVYKLGTLLEKSHVTATDFQCNRYIARASSCPATSPKMADPLSWLRVHTSGVTAERYLSFRYVIHPTLCLRR
jgi:hypothetical protein